MATDPNIQAHNDFLVKQLKTGRIIMANQQWPNEKGWTPPTKIFLLKPIHEHKPPFDPWWDKAFGFVVRALDEKHARIYASEHAGDEKGWGDDSNPWLDEELTSCDIIMWEGNHGVILRDMKSA